MSTTAGRAAADGRVRQVATVTGRIAVGLVVPSALYYLLRSLGQSVYLSLVVSTLLSAAPALSAVVRRRPVDRLAGSVTVMTVAGLAIALVPGDTRFLLAKESVMTAAAGTWFLVSAGARRPLTFRVTRPLLQGRLRWPADWDGLWDVSPRFRRMWRVSSLLWGLGLLADAAGRVVLAYTRPPDAVPALGLALYVVTAVVLNLVVNAYYTLCGVHDARSSLRRPDLTGPPAPLAGS